MAKFDFQLEGVLRHRKSVERDRRRALAVVQAQMQLLQNELKGLDQTVTDATADLRANNLTGTVDLNFLAAHRRFIGATRRKAMAIVQKMALLQRDVDEARRQLVVAAKDRKVIEKLREKDHERWRADVEKRSTDEMDEIGTQISYRNFRDEALETTGEQAGDS